MDYTSLVLSQCKNISWKVAEARVMKDRCQQLGQKVASVEEIVRALQNSSVTPQVGGALQRLYTSLMSADDLIQKCTVKRWVNKSKYKTKFNILDQHIQDTLRVLATVPHVSQGPSSGHAPARNHTTAGYIVEEVDDDSYDDDDDYDDDDNLGILLPYAQGGVMGSRAPQPNLQYEIVVLTDGSSALVAEHMSMHF